MTFTNLGQAEQWDRLQRQTTGTTCVTGIKSYAVVHLGTQEQNIKPHPKIQICNTAVSISTCFVWCFCIILCVPAPDARTKKSDHKKRQHPLANESAGVHQSLIRVRTAPVSHKDMTKYPSYTSYTNIDARVSYDTVSGALFPEWEFPQVSCSLLSLFSRGESIFALPPLINKIETRYALA